MVSIPVTLDGDKSVEITYAPMTYNLSIQAITDGSDLPIEVKVNGESVTTPTTVEVEEGTVTVEVPDTVEVEGRKYALLTHEVR